MDVTLIRFVFVAALVSAGYFLRPFPRPSAGNALVSAIVGGILAVAIILFETRIRKATLKTLIGGAVGSILGIAGATLICWIITSQQAISDELKSFLTLTLTALMGYVGLIVGAVKGDYLDLSALGGIFVEKGVSKAHSLILDTSVIIDGRVADIAETGFLAGILVIPQFVLRELQQIADSADSIKRNRGRRGLGGGGRRCRNAALRR